MTARLLDFAGAALLPRAPSHEHWLAMTPEQRLQVVESLPFRAVDGEMAPPEGDLHRMVKTSALDTLQEFFRQTKRSVYLAADMLVYYPDEPRFAPDLLAVRDVSVHPRNSWIVDHEGKGLDFVIEVHVAGDARKDLERNVGFYARLGIPEYFIYDVGRLSLAGYRLREAGRKYERIVPQGGRFSSQVLGLDLEMSDGKLRFLLGNALLLESAELLERANALLQQMEEAAAKREVEYAEAVRRAEEEARRAKEEARRAEEGARRAEEETRRADSAERRAAELAAELERLKRGQ